MTSTSKKLLKDLPSEERMDEIMNDLKPFGPQATAIMGAAYIEHALEQLLRATLRPLPKKEHNDKLYDGRANGILGTFSAKIKIAYATKLLDPKVYEALLLINDIRVTFAHSLHVVSFDHEYVAQDCRALAKISDVMAEATGMYQPDLIEPQDIYARIVRLLYYSIHKEILLLSESSDGPAP